ncbi:MAG: CBS domain-containing protein, partial [Armatimonadetes bacterium]|nr:CBS domain-containing protein [Armatimonadota bacterium]
EEANTLGGFIFHHLGRVPESKPVVDLLGEMRDRRIALAVVVEEFGGTAGIVTIEDLVEEIVGEIPGEFRREEGFIRLKRSNLIVVDAAIPLADLNDAFEIDLPTEEANTLGGFIFHHLGRVPERGFRFRTDRLELTIEAMTGPRIDLVRIRKLI